MNMIRAPQSQGEQEHFDLLPFIALMMIVLAVLLFITMTMAALNVGAGAAEGWIPTKTKDAANSKIPILVEWDGETAIIQRPSGHQKITLGREVRRWWNSDWQFRNTEMRRFWNDMKSQATTHYVLFAVRPSGFENFQTLASEFRSAGVSVGYEPVEQTKRIRLKMEENGTP